jgi:hypothetical protein
MCFVVTSLECCEKRHRYSMVTCSYLCLPKIFQHIGIPPVAPWSFACGPVLWDGMRESMGYIVHIYYIRNVCCGNYVSSLLQNCLHCEFCAQPRLAFGLQMLELQLPIMNHVMICPISESSQIWQDGGSRTSHSNRPLKRSMIWLDWYWIRSTCVLCLYSELSCLQVQDLFQLPPHSLVW